MLRKTDAEADTPVIVSSRPHHAFLCFHALETHLTQNTSASSTPPLATHFDTLLKNEAFPPCPLFITWNTRRNPSRKELRGCIGTFQAQPLDNGLKTYALTAALDDTRFPPIAARELEHLECSVSLLHAFEPADTWDDWEVGTHGISIHFTHANETSRFSRRASYSATFLPEVAGEQGWDVLETMRHLIRKTGCSIYRYGDDQSDQSKDSEEQEEEEELVFGRHWDGSTIEDGVPLRQLLADVRVERYQSSKCSVSYTEYLDFINTLRDQFNAR